MGVILRHNATAPDGVGANRATEGETICVGDVGTGQGNGEAVTPRNEWEDDRDKEQTSDKPGHVCVYVLDCFTKKNNVKTFFLERDRIGVAVWS